MASNYTVVIIAWIAHQVYMVCYSFSDLFWFIIRLWNEEKKKQKKLYFKKKIREKKFDLRPPEIEPNYSAIDAYGISMWPGPKDMRLKLAHYNRDKEKNKNKVSNPSGPSNNSVSSFKDSDFSCCSF